MNGDDYGPKITITDFPSMPNITPLADGIIALHTDTQDIRQRMLSLFETQNGFNVLVVEQIKELRAELGTVQSKIDLVLKAQGAL